MIDYLKLKASNYIEKSIENRTLESDKDSKDWIVIENLKNNSEVSQKFLDSDGKSTIIACKMSEIIKTYSFKTENTEIFSEFKRMLVSVNINNFNLEYDQNLINNFMIYSSVGLTADMPIEKISEYFTNIIANSNNIERFDDSEIIKKINEDKDKNDDDIDFHSKNNLINKVLNSVFSGNIYIRVVKYSVIIGGLGCLGYYQLIPLVSNKIVSNEVSRMENKENIEFKDILRLILKKFNLI